MMNIDLPLTITATAGAGLVPRRWLVLQTKNDGTVLYAQTFIRRSSAERAKEAADARRGFLSTRTPAHVIRLPYDRR